MELYNRAVVHGLALAETDHSTELNLAPRNIELPIGTLEIVPPANPFRFGGYEIVHPLRSQT